jgi:hypothetical protein
MAMKEGTRLTDSKASSMAARNGAVSSLSTTVVKNTTDCDVIICSHLIRTCAHETPYMTNVVSVVPNLVHLVKNKDICQPENFMIDMRSEYELIYSLTHKKKAQTDRLKN